MDLGIKLYADENYDAAIVEFEAAYDDTPKASPLINIALCHKAMFRYPKAIAALEQALRLHLDTVDKPEAARTALDELKELVSSIVVQVEPAGVSIREASLDGELLDVASLDQPIYVGPGKHRLTIGAEGYETTTEAFSIASGQDAVAIAVRLSPTQGKLVFIAPEGVELHVDGQPVGSSRWAGWLEPGSHLVEIYDRAGEATYTITVGVSAGSAELIELREDGLLVVGDREPRPADGTDAGESPPLSGVYGLGELAIYGLAAEQGSGLGYAGGARVGYRFTRIVGVELMFQHGLAGQTEEDLRSTRIGANLRLMTSPDVVRFVMTSGLGLAYDDLETVAQDSESGAGGYFLLEPGLEIDLDGPIFGFGTAFLGTISDTEIAVVKGQFATALRAGYGFW